MQLELDFLKPVGDVFAVDSPDEDLPFVGVIRRTICGLSLGVKWMRDAAKDCIC